MGDQSMTRLRAALLCFLVIHSAVFAQQRPDERYNPKIERPSYTAAGPVIAVDEGHRNFQTLETGYEPFGRLASADGYRVRSVTGGFTTASLAGVDVLIVANARSSQPQSSAFDDAEIDTLRQWVQDGGSLFLIADHAPFGSASSRLAEAFGVNMGLGYAVSWQDGRVSSEIRFRGAGLGQHPIIAGSAPWERVKSVKSFTGQSLGIPANATGLLLLPSDTLEVEKRDQIALLARGGSVAARAAVGRAQAVALNFGRGRVVVAGEAAMFTEQIFPRLGRLGLTAEDDQKFTLNVLHWLSRLIGQDGSAQ